VELASKTSPVTPNIITGRSFAKDTGTPSNNVDLGKMSGLYNIKTHTEMFGPSFGVITKKKFPDHFKKNV